MRPRRGTALNNKAVFLALVVFGTLCVLGNLVQLFDVSSLLAAASSVALVAVGAGAVWRGGFMLEWWGPPENDRHGRSIGRYQRTCFPGILCLPRSGDWL